MEKRSCPLCRGAVVEMITLGADGSEIGRASVDVAPPNGLDHEARQMGLNGSRHQPSALLSAYDRAVLRTFRQLSTNLRGYGGPGWDDGDAGRRTRGRNGRIRV